MKRAKSLLIALAVAAGLVVGYLQILPPLSMPKNFVPTGKTLAQADAEPDLDLMLSHIKAMASQVHSVDTEGIHITHAYLADQLRQMGYAPTEETYQLTISDIQALEAERAAHHRAVWRTDEASIRDYSGIGNKPTMNLRNIYVTLDAPDTDDTILFMAHTDSVKMGPGAFDDTVSVAAMLEGLRALTGVTPVRDMVFLFTDGEEQGLLGAAMFVKDHPELKEKTKLVVNLEARGNRGALLMFETTDNNLNMVREYVRAAPGPVTLSIATSVYRIMRNDTDLTRFIMEGYPGINFAVIDGADVYHTALDNYDTFDRKSAMHYLGTVTALATDFATRDSLPLKAGEDGVFFPFIPGRVMVLSRTAADILAFAAPVATITALVFLFIRRRIAWRSVLAGFGITLLALAATALLTLGLMKLADAVPAFQTALYGNNGLGLMILCAVVALLTVPLFVFMPPRRGEGTSLALGTLLLPAVLAPVLVSLFPSASYLFSLPVLLGLVGVLFNPWCKAGVLHAAIAFATLLLFVPLAALVLIALGADIAFGPVILLALPLAIAMGQWRMGQGKAIAA